MLGEVRSLASSWVSKIILGLIILSFIVWSGSSITGVGSSDDKIVVATINGKDVGISRLQQELNAQSKIYGPMFDGQDPDRVQNFLVQMSMRNITDNVLQQMTMEDEGAAISEEVVLRSIRGQEIFRDENGSFSPAMFKSFLAQNSMSESDFYNLAVERTQGRLLATALINEQFISPITRDLAFAKQEQKRNFSILSISRTDVEKSINISSNDIGSYYEKHKSSYIDPEKVIANYIEFSQSDVVVNEVPTRSELDNMIKDEKERLKNNKKVELAHIFLDKNNHSDAQLESLKKEISGKLSSKNFGALVQEYSEDSFSKEKGGSLGFDSVDVLPLALQKAANSLKSGQIGKEPIISDYGVHFVKLLRKEEPKMPSDKALEKTLIASWKKNLQKKIFKEKLEELDNALYQGTIEDVAKQYRLKLRSSTPFVKGAVSKGLWSKNPEILEALFSDDVLRDNLNSKLIAVDDSTFVAVAKKKKIESRQKTLKEVKSDIRKAILSQKTQSKADSVIKESLSRLQAGKSKASVVSYIKKQFKIKNLKWRSYKNVDRKSYLLPRDLINFAFNIPEHMDNQTRFASYPKWSDGKLSLIELVKFTDGNYSKASDLQKQEFINSFSARLGSEILEYYINNARSQAKIVINPAMQGDGQAN